MYNEAMKERFKGVPATYVFLLKDDEILLMRRYNTGYEDGKYCLPAGHVEEGETPLQGIIREAREEVGVTLQEEDLQFSVSMYRKGPNDTRIEFFYLATQWEGEPINAEPNKCDEVTWFPLSDLPENTIEYIRAAIEAYRTGTIYLEFGW